MIVNPTTAADHPDIRGAQISNPMVQAALWSWYESNTERVILKVTFLKIRVKDLRILFELIAGPEPR